MTKEQAEKLIIFTCTHAQAVAARDLLQKYSIGPEPSSKVRLMLEFNSKLHKAIAKSEEKI